MKFVSIIFYHWLLCAAACTEAFVPGHELSAVGLTFPGLWIEMGLNDDDPSVNDPLILQRTGNNSEPCAPSASLDSLAGLTEEKMPSGMLNV